MQTLKRGASGTDVELLQRLLCKKSYHVGADGIFGNDTEVAVRKFQKDYGLVSDGIVGQRTWDMLQSDSAQSLASLRLTESDFKHAADLLGVEVAAIKAVLEVETGNKGGFLAVGKPTILFEGHIFWSQLKNRGIDPAKHQKGNEDILYPKWTKTHYQGGLKEYDRLERARAIHREAADSSASWGLAQIMGFNYQVSGCKSVSEFVEMMTESEGKQLELFVRFIKGNRWDGYLRNLDWKEFARHYNGSGYAQNQYDKRLDIVFSNQKIYELILKMQINEEPKCNDMPNDLLIFNAEKDIFTDLPIMDSLFLADKLKVGKTKLRTVSLKKNLENLKIREFLDSNVLGEEYTKLRAENLALIYAVFSQWKGGEDFIDLSCLDKIHTLSLNLLQLGDDFIALFLPHISGTSKSVCNSYTVGLFLNLIAESMDKLSDKEWISVNLFSKQLRYWGLNSVGVDLFCLIKPSSYRTKLSNNWTSKAINFDDILPQITLPAIKSIFFLLASWGMVEIAYQSPNGSNTVSPFDGVEYVRLTALGRFAFGIDSEYTPPVVVESVKDFELSSDRLLIKFLDADSPRRAVFSQFAKAVTPVLYSVDFSSFLEGCTIRNEVESKIKKFRNIVKENLPEVWETFFSELLNRCDPLLKVKTSYVVRRINSNDKRLQEIILTDKELKKYIVRAENYIILMEQKNMDKVSHILRGYGYLI